jgi:four helix bundle suffix protein
MKIPAKQGDGFIALHCGYSGLLAYEKALVVLEGTARLCKRFLEKRDRTQMVQAARSGKQNIVEFYETYKTYIDARPAKVVANILIYHIHQRNYLLDQLPRKLEKDFLEEGGPRERMTRARFAQRAKQNRSPFA